jgi:ribonuclease HII
MSAALPAGVDEAGRGPLAGPVVVAAVILDPARPINGLADSKALTVSRRALLADLIRTHALAWSVVAVEADEIDRLNILQATFEGMRRAIAALEPTPTEIWIDGNQVPTGLTVPARAIVQGDATVAAISAASILAKTSRDATLQAMDAHYPGYGFAIHKGYPTPQHLAALDQLGPCPIHRHSYAPVRLRAMQGRLF